jgi:hypothetical protein
MTMYFHPHLFNALNDDRMMQTCIALAGVWMNGVDRHRAARVEAMRALCTHHIEATRSFADIAVDTQRRAMKLLEAHAAELAHDREQPTERVRERPSRPGNGARGSSKA